MGRSKWAKFDLEIGTNSWHISLAYSEAESMGLAVSCVQALNVCSARNFLLIRQDATQLSFLRPRLCQLPQAELVTPTPTWVTSALGFRA